MIHPPAGERTVEYDLDALRANLIRCDNNILIFEEAIDKEHRTKKDLRHMITTLEEKFEREKRHHD